MKIFVLLFIQPLFLTACAEKQVTPVAASAAATSPEKISPPSLIKHEIVWPELGKKPSKPQSVQINGKKFLRYSAATPWRLFDTELSQYVTATHVLVLSCKDLAETLAAAGMKGTLQQWQKIALNTYQAGFDMQLIEQYYRRLHKAGFAVEWQLDYSEQRLAEEM